MAYSDDPDTERLPDDEEQLTDFHPNDRMKENSSSPSGSAMRTKILYLCAYTFCVALVAFIAFDQGFVVLAGSEVTAPAPISIAPASATETTSQYSAWSIAQSEAERVLSQSTSRETLSCLNADKAKTETVARDALAGKYKSTSVTANAESRAVSKVGLPALNLGMPKCGTTSQSDFFHCAGYKASHSVMKDLSHQGLCMRDAAWNNLPVLDTCTKGTDALTELDGHSAFGLPYKMGQYTSKEKRDDCFFPQLSLLEEMHDNDPHATFILPFRPVKDWVDSVLNWAGGFGIKEVMECELPNLPKGVPEITLPKEELVAHFEQYICSHVIHVRNFVEAHPTHALIEYDLYDKPTTSKVLGSIFPMVKTNTESSDCWQHVAHKTDLHAGDKTVSF